MRVEFVVHSVPVPQPRQRTRAFIDRSGNARSQNYTPVKHPANVFKAAIQESFGTAYDGPPLDGPVSMSLSFVMPRPESLNRKRGDNPRIRDTRKRGDVDNLCKAVFDALNLLAYRDDSQISRLVVDKWIASASEQPHVVVVIEPLDLFYSGGSDEVQLLTKKSGGQLELGGIGDADAVTAGGAPEYSG